MANYDYIIIGGGITGSALAYELARHDLKVLLLEKDWILDNATVYSYGGLAYWSGSTDLIKFLYKDSLYIYESLTHELNFDIEFRILDLLLTIDPDDDIKAIQSINQKYEIQPELIDVDTACEMEPLLNRYAIAGAFKQEHGHIHPRKTNEAYQSAFTRSGGEIKIERVIDLIRDKDEIKGVKTNHNSYYGGGVIVCAGGLSRKLLQEAGIETKLYFTHSQILAIPPTEIKMRSMVMPAVIKRLQVEREIYSGEDQSIWNTPSGEIVNTVTESGAIQFSDGSIYVGQSSEIMTDPLGAIELGYYENQLRNGIRNILPPLAHLEGKVCNCLVAFSDPNDSLIGPIPGLKGIHLFNGFTSTLIVTPSLARHFANYLAGNQDEVMAQLLY
ncbi:MAG: Monomeric sarcosine oxidase [Chroococcopsis gigantea SAG 12.99]|jgi:glycine/D-amino acid oxidase-like deaminating enzyme|nr:FAD-binding oxidoreductase [Chlorogloea purpurea SAG 13.99]MDV2999155.1 Monomeric sarcosine oxidase [Chroococcopsis gigantea SAG 12.99]